MPTRLDDLKTALLLSGCFGAMASVTVPVMLPHLPPEARQLSLPLPVFSAILLIQATIIYGLFGFLGLRLARASGIEPSPFFSALWTGRALPALQLGYPLLIGLAAGIALVGSVTLIRLLAPTTLPETLHPPSPLAALLASASGSVGEEILCRLLVLSGLLWCLPKTWHGKAIAVLVSALLFGALHAPACIFLFGGIGRVPPLAWCWLISLNGMLGVAFGMVYVRWGIGAATIAHFGADLVWHVATQVAS